MAFIDELREGAEALGLDRVVEHELGHATRRGPGAGDHVGMLAAEDNFGATVPAWVKDRNVISRSSGSSVTTSQNAWVSPAQISTMVSVRLPLPSARKLAGSSGVCSPKCDAFRGWFSCRLTARTSHHFRAGTHAPKSCGSGG